MQTAQPEIFFSYAWGGEKEEYAIALYDALKAAGYKVVMDRHDVQYRESFTQFMLRIGRGAFIVVIISDKYLRSPFCMFELLEIYRKSNSELGEMVAKVFPVIMGDADIYDDAGILQYTKYWRQKTNDLRSGMTDEMDLVDTVDFGTKLKRYNEIANNMANFGLWLQDINIPKPEVLAANIYERITTAIANNWQQVQKLQASDGLPHHLTAHPFISEVFFGRVEELAEIHTKLFEGDNLLLLVNGMGGVGKTTLATHYYYSYANEYAHLAWVLSQKSIANALLLLAVPLGLRFEDTMPTEARLQVLLAQMANLNKPCLLVIDNANELEDLQANYMALRSCPNFHLLLTTRIDKFEKAPVCKIGALPYDTALELFTEHYTGHDAAEDELFKQVYEAVDGNTLIIELLAKNLYVQNLVRSHYPLSELVADLQKGLLSISQTKPVSTHYHSNTLLKGEPLDIIAAMYDIGELSAAEKRLLSNLAVLPAENIPFTVLESLLPDTPQLEETLVSLSLKGWIEHNQFEAAFKISPFIQEITRIKNTDLLEDCEEIFYTLFNKLTQRQVTGDLLNVEYETALIYARYGETGVSNIKHPNSNLILLLEKIADFYKTIGNFDKAMLLYKKANNILLSICKDTQQNTEHTVMLAKSFSYLGDICNRLGHIDEAMYYYEVEMKIFEELCDRTPQNIDYKMGLSVSYNHLSLIYRVNGKTELALQLCRKHLKISTQLCKYNPKDIGLKRKLAVSHSGLSELYFFSENIPLSLSSHKKSNILFEEIFNINQQDQTSTFDLAISKSRAGDIYMKLGKFSKALSNYMEYNIMAKELHLTSPYVVIYKLKLVRSYIKLGTVYEAKKDANNAYIVYSTAKQLLDDYTLQSPEYPEHPEYQQYLVFIITRLSELKG